jgi:hypothetical protein
MKYIPKLHFTVLALLLMIITIHCQSESTALSDKHHEALDPYVQFLKKTHQKPVDYVMDLFKNHDIVILCERAHPEATQYNFIYDLVSDPRFIDNVGHVFTELGTISQARNIESYLKTRNLDENEAERRLLYIYRNVTFNPVWNNSNFYEFLKNLRRLNSSLPAEKKLHLYFSDVPFAWEGMSRKKYQEFQNILPQRDKIMADQIIHKFSEIQSSDRPRKKALVIMNFRHAFNDRFEKPGGAKGDNVGRYIFETFPGKAANVMINSVRVMIGSTDQDVIMAPIQDGKWDAAFAVQGNPSIGFDFASSPFGQDEFDFFPSRKEGLTYQDVFTGFLFYEPLEKHKFVYQIPALFEDGFGDAVVSRYVQTGMTVQEAKQHVEEIRQKSESRYGNFEEMEKTIWKWIN